MRPLIFLKKQKISLEELYGYASSDEESTNDDDDDDNDGDVPTAQEDVQDVEHVDGPVTLCVEEEAIEGNFIRLSKICDT